MRVNEGTKFRGSTGRPVLIRALSQVIVDGLSSDDA
jgi:hypothetical protein